MTEQRSAYADFAAYCRTSDRRRADPKTAGMRNWFAAERH